MYYKLEENLNLRGWQRTPYAVVDSRTGIVSEINKNEMSVLDMCNGKIDFDILPFSAEKKSILGVLVEEGVIIASEKPDPIRKEQEYLIYENRLIRRAHWSITGRCNYKCRHCFLSAPDAKYGELPLSDILAIIDELKACGIPQVNLTGGEPLVRKDFWDIVDALTEKNIIISTVYSNGALVNEKLLKGFSDRGLFPEFSMSYDGPDGLHGWLRGVEKADADIERAFLLCRDNGFNTDAEMCLHAGNIHTIRKSVNILASWGCSALKAVPVSSVGAWKENGCDGSVPCEKVFEAFLDYLPHYFEDNAPLDLQLAGVFMCDKGTKDVSVPMVKKCTDASKTYVCLHALNNMYISPEGRALLCMSLGGIDIQNNFPFILDKGLRYCLSDSFYMKVLETPASRIIEHNEKCRNCKYALKCLGGCRAGALETTPEDYLGADESFCSFFRGGYLEKLKEVLDKCGVNSIE